MIEDPLVYQGIQAGVKDYNEEMSQMSSPDLVEHNEMNFISRDKMPDY